MKRDRCYNLGLLEDNRIESARRVYWGGGCSPTLMTGAEKDVKVLINEETNQYHERGDGLRD